MDPLIWAKAHGAMTHFPLALMPCSTACDVVGYWVRHQPIQRDLCKASRWAVVLAAAACFPAVLSGLLMTKGSLLGHGWLRLHHLFVWPAFALMVGLATWRTLHANADSVAHRIGYIVVSLVTTSLIVGAGYWGGEMMMTPGR